ncbi:MAG TPA: glycosyltransferase, partial [Virgibacillus sp.]|nr:glycosyltransferase [Virgibacillus sp.]
MKILHLNAGNETGGGMYHILSLLEAFNREEFILGVLEEGELLQRAKQADIQTIHFSHKRKMSIPLLRKMKQYLEKEEIHYVHTHGPRANVYANLLKKVTAFHWIVTIHSDPDYDFSGKGMYGHFLSRLNINALKQADRLITVSEPLRVRMVEQGVAHHKVTTAWNGIDFRTKSDLPFTRQDMGLAEDDFIFLMVARLEPVKGHQVALKAFAEIIKEKKNCRLILLGDGSLKKDLEDLSAQLGISDEVQFLGYRNDVERFYQLADVTLLTSFSEGFPLVLLESAREKTPVISTNVGSVGELIKDEFSWKVKPGCVHALIAAMKDTLICDDEGLLGQKGQQ